MSDIIDKDELLHYGTPRHSGRYPWGSGENPYQRHKNFISYVSDLRKKGMTDAEIAKGMDMNSKELRARYSIAKDEKRQMDYATALRLKDKGYSITAIGRRMGINESSVRSLLDPAKQERSKITMATANMLKDQLKKNTYLDVGAGIENYVGCSRTKLDTSLEVLKAQGYEVYSILTEQLGTGKMTTVKVLCPPGTTFQEVSKNRDKIGSIAEWSDDGGRTYLGLEKPRSVSSDRVAIRYADDGGDQKDGVIELRRGVEDISLGNSSYAQVRIAVDDTHYLKGMAVYSDNMPKGVDIIFNTNKHKIDPNSGKENSKKDVLKPLKDDPDNPFGATVKQRHYIGEDGKEHLSAVNIVNAEGDWEGWKKTLASQVLSKQSLSLAKKQLAKGYDAKLAEYEELSSLTNPVVKKKLLLSFADSCDSSSVHLEAAAMPRQASHVILPLTTLKDNEIYAPRYRDGETVVLIRYPHGGKFEIPELKVNNRNKEGKSVITNTSKDAVGINYKVAQQLSGADFDGDTVLVIPNKKGSSTYIQSSKSLSSSEASAYKELRDFDPKIAYPGYKGMKVMDDETKGRKMGEVSNLITDMTIKGASADEICRAVKHSMVVIDAVKHELDWKTSYRENRIGELAKKYQGKASGGASTIISKAKSPTYVTARGRELIDPNTGKKYYKDKKNNFYTDKEGNYKERKTKSTKMAETYDARELSSGQPMEAIYADHANKLKALANKSRKEAVNTPNMKTSTTAKKIYSEEVAKLKADLNIAEKNRPLERQAQLLASTVVKAKRQANPYMEKDDLKRLKNQALDEARRRVGANKKSVQINISDRQWEAIQAGAVSTNTLTKILNNTDEDRIKQLATPRNKEVMSPSRIARAKAMLDAGCTQAEAADQLGVSVSTLSKAIS